MVSCRPSAAMLGSTDVVRQVRSCQGPGSTLTPWTLGARFHVNPTPDCAKSSSSSAQVGCQSDEAPLDLVIHRSYCRVRTTSALRIIPRHLRSHLHTRRGRHSQIDALIN